MLENREKSKRVFNEIEAEFKEREEWIKKYTYTDDEILEADEKGITLPPKPDFFDEIKF